MHAAIEWSYELLDPIEQRSARQLAVFVGGFDAAAATAVAPELALDVLARLVDKSIITVVESPGRQTRYRLLETVREFTHELLVEADELDSARERHLQHFSVDDEIPLDGSPSTRAEAILDQFEHDYGNVRAALEWAATRHPEAAARYGPGPPVPASGGLSARELEVVHLVASGRSNRRSPPTCTCPCGRSRVTYVTRSPRSASRIALSSPPGRTSTVGSESASLVGSTRAAVVSAACSRRS